MQCDQNRTTLASYLDGELSPEQAATIHTHIATCPQCAVEIAELASGLNDGEKHQVLLGVTGSGKTFTMAKLIEKFGRPALVMAHNGRVELETEPGQGATFRVILPLS